MSFIKNAFTIKDLENLSGVKKHTIRIWEKRYNLLSPERTATNIRYYTTKSLIRLLNIVLLYNNGYKISKIADLSQDELLAHSSTIVSQRAQKNQFINDMKIAMFSFNQQQFEESYRRLNEKILFQDIFKNYFLPFLNELGYLWQTDTINPAHEHFIGNLIKQKILVQTEKLMTTKPKNENYKFVLFLPDNEIHDLGISYLNYEILNKGFQTIFLGQSVPIDCLKSFSSIKSPVIFISYFTVQPEFNKISSYLKSFKSKILKTKHSKLWLLGHRVQNINKVDLPKKIRTFHSTPEVLSELDLLLEKKDA